MKTCRKTILLFLGIILAGWSAGCTGPNNSTPSAAVKRTPDQIPPLKIGMSTDEIRKQLGSPVEVKPMNPPEEFTEIWVYRLEGPVRATQVITGSRSVPGFAVPGFSADDPQMRMIEEPLYSLSEQRTTAVLQLLIFKGQLAAHKRSVERKTKYN